MAVVFDWTEERSNRLMSLYQDGLSFTLIAAKMGCSRNAAIGRAHRMKLAARDPTTVVEKITKRVKRTMSTSAVTVKAIAVRKPVPKSRVTGHECEITELTDKSCRFPLWAHEEPHGFDGRSYCGAPEADIYAGKPYCHYHARICTPERS